ncbi:MAG: hypothetical protein KF716_26850 [Anaerolineae bacterium]|nr:hypothetical protein [Anaerolineae bacterium]
MSDLPPEKSLRDELKRRKTQQLQQAQADAQKRATQAASEPKGQQPSQPAQPSKPAPSNLPSASPTRPPSARPPAGQPEKPPSFSLNNQRTLIIAFVGVLFLVVCLGTVLITNNLTPTTPTLTPIKLPLTTARDVLNYLIRAGVQVTNVRDIEVPNETWRATQGVQFDAQIGDVRGVFIILSYDGTDTAGSDAYKMEIDAEYGPWKTYSISNILVLSTPDTPQSIDIDVASHITSYIAGTVIAFLPTSTGTFLGAAVTDAAGTQVAQLATDNMLATRGTPVVLTVDATIITLTPRPPTETSPPTNTRTPRPTRTPTIPPTLTSTRTPIPPRDTRTPISTAQQVPPSVPATTVPISASPTPDRSRAQRFVDDAPRFLEPLRMDTSTITVDQYGATFSYVTNDGLQYQIVLWLTGAPESAQERFSLDFGLVTGSQPVSMGDQAFIAPPENTTLGEMLYQDMVLIIYYPRYSSTVPPSPISQDDLLRLMQRLYLIMPAQ